MYPTVLAGVCVRGEGGMPGMKALTKLLCLSRGLSWSPGAYGGGVVPGPINAPGMGRFYCLIWGLWVTVKVLGSDCNKCFPNTNHNRNHSSNNNLTLNPKSNPKLTLTLTVY